MNITIEVLPNDQLRPNVDGCDWQWTPEGNLKVQVAPLSDWRREVLLGIHEAVEAIMCKHSGVTQEQVDAFDLEYDRTHEIDLYAGDDASAPYKTQHTFATAIERILAGAMNVDWSDYDKEVATSYPGPRHKQ
jgi:hypothetical protein